MSFAVRVENVSKLFRIRHGDGASYRTLREEIAHAVTYPWRRLRGEPRPSEEEFWALREIDFEVRPGEVVGIVGRNGAGKSTLLKILSRITRPTTGRVEMRGRIGSLLEVGTGFHPELTGRENIFLSGAVLGMKRAEISRKFDEIVAFAEIEKFLDTPIKRFSSGMYVRLAFSVAAHLEPHVLIVDEVLAVGDAAFQKKCFGKVRDAAERGTTVLFVSHNLAAVHQFCSRAIWIDRGRMRANGPPEDVTRQYLSDDESLTAARRWNDLENAPGDDRVRLTSVALLQDDRPSSVIDINRPCEIALAFNVLKPVTNLVSGVSLHAVDGECILSNLDWRPNALAIGPYTKRVRFPGPLLAEGRFSATVRLMFYEPEIRSVILPEAVLFDAVDTDHPHSVRGPFKGNWPGAVRLPLEWTDAAPSPGADR